MGNTLRICIDRDPRELVSRGPLAANDQSVTKMEGIVLQRRETKSAKLIRLDTGLYLGRDQTLNESEWAGKLSARVNASFRRSKICPNIPNMWSS